MKFNEHIQNNVEYIKTPTHLHNKRCRTLWLYKRDGTPCCLEHMENYKHITPTMTKPYWCINSFGNFVAVQNQRNPFFRCEKFVKYQSYCFHAKTVETTSFRTPAV